MRKGFAIMVTVGVAAAAAVAGVATASAAEVQRGHGVEACPANRFCLYEDVGWNETDETDEGGAVDTSDKLILIFEPDQEAGRIPDFGVSSVVNNTETTFCLYSEQDFGGTGKLIWPGYGWGSDLGEFNDVTKSVLIVNSEDVRVVDGLAEADSCRTS